MSFLTPVSPIAVRNPVPVKAPAATGKVSAQDVCGAVRPGYARCLSVRPAHVVEPVTMYLRNHASAGNTAAAPAGFGPSDLAAAYALNTSGGSGQTVAIVDAFDNPTAERDLTAYRAQYGLPACTTANGCFRKVNQSGAASPLPAANSGWSLEIALDVDMVSAVCPQCHILLVEATSNYTSDLGASVDTAVALGAKFVSNSYGGGDSSADAAHYNHPGVAITASTGDNGYGVAFPASAPTVTAVGGTSLSRASTSRGWTETAWRGAGSGCSAVFGQPAMQGSVATGCANRAVADVSAVADPNTGLAVYNGSGWTVLGGTSASSPIIAAVYALAGTPASGDYPNSYPYAHSSELSDVTAGSNGSCGGLALCTAKTGWDGPTGLGTPDGAGAFSATGLVGPPAKLGASVAVASPVVPGLATTASVTPLLPVGDAVKSISWKSARSDCVFTAPTTAQSQLSCAAAAAGSTTVTATVIDTAGVSKVVTVPLAFASAGAKRAVAISFGVVGQSGPNQSVCASASTPVQATVVDVLSGMPIKGISVGFTRQTGTTTPVKLTGGISGGDGVATTSLNTATAVTMASGSAAAGPFSAGAAAVPVAVTAAKCSPALTVQAAKTSIYYGDPVTMSGTLTRSSDFGPVAIAGAPVQLTELVAGKTVVLGTATSSADGSFAGTVKPTASGTLGAALAVRPSWFAVTATAGSLSVSVPRTALTAAASSADVGYGAPVVVSGTLVRQAGASTTGVAAATVTIKSTPAVGVASVLGSARVNVDGSWLATVTPRATGTLSAVFVGAPGLPAASTVIGPLTVGTWTALVTLKAQYAAQIAGTRNLLTGTATRSYQGVSTAAASVAVRVYLQTSDGASKLLGTATTNAAGNYSLSAVPMQTGAIVAKVAGVAGYYDATSDSVALTVTAK